MTNLDNIKATAWKLGLHASRINEFRLASEINLINSLVEVKAIYGKRKIEKNTFIRFSLELYQVESCWGSEIGGNCYVLTTCGELLLADVVEIL